MTKYKIKFKTPGDLSGGLALFIIVITVALVELYFFSKKARFSIAGRSPFYGIKLGEGPHFVPLPEEQYESGAPRMCEYVQGYWTPFDPNEPMNGEGCCAEALDPDLLTEFDVPLCEDLGFEGYENDMFDGGYGGEAGYGEPGEPGGYGYDDDDDDDDKDKKKFFKKMFKFKKKRMKEHRKREKEYEKEFEKGYAARVVIS